MAAAQVMIQANLFENPAADFPEGFRYASGIVTPDEEHALVRELVKLPLREFEFQGFLGKRRVVSFGWRYDFNGGRFQKADPIPAFLLPLRKRAARFAEIEPDALAHVLVLEYPPGAAIGWHKDRPMFDDVVGISLKSPCTFRFRHKAGVKWERRSITAEPRSMYLLQGPARNEWEHSIPSVDALRYSVTFRSLKHA